MPKNIVLLSDGTGNSAAKLMKTNVWRMYEAVELSSGDQVAFYDNGVGTSSFKPFALLGGGLGWGLKRNVLRLYMFACSHYAGATDVSAADQIFAFGFSRGAFTIRVLIGLIESQGLVVGAKGAELERRARWAYREYRREFNSGTWLVRRLRGVRDWLLSRIVERKPAGGAAPTARPRVTFVGLWDTVDAYGLPIDEMTRGWDQWVWPLSMSRHELPSIVDKLCHAVALDDERQTFHPLLLDESHHPDAAHTDDETLTQVWFAGAHSNVGGGYPDDSLAHVPLRWMASEAAKRGLRLHPHVTADWKARSDPNGPAYDSRGGLGAYYRYHPRSIARLTDDRFADVAIPRPKIHESVFARIVAGRDDYAPIVLPERYAVVRDGGAIADGPAGGLEHPTQSGVRCVRQERVWDVVWWRRGAYFATVILTFVLIAMPLVVAPGGVLPWKPRSVAGVIALIGNLLPDLATSWVDYYQQDPVFLLVGGLLVAGLLVRSATLQQSIRDQQRLVWDGIVARPQAVLVLVAVGTANRAVFATASAAGWTCPAVDTPRPWRGELMRFELPASELCQATGLELERGDTYTVSITLPPVWTDGAAMAVGTAAGFGSGVRPWVFLPALPFRRVLTASWFTPMVRIGSHGAEYHTLSDGHVTFSPAQTGQLFLFVNDALGVGPWLRTFYCNNQGTATVAVVKGDAGALSPTGARPLTIRAGRTADGEARPCPD